MKVYVLSKLRFIDLMIKNQITNDNIEEKIDCFFISINDTIYSNSNNTPYFTENKNNLKIMHFDDVDYDIYDTIIVKDTNGKLKTILDKNTLKAKAITEEQAKELFDFILQNKDKKICIVHCAAGISRSGAVGKFVNELYGEPYDVFKMNNPYIHPNQNILNLLKKN